MLFDEAIPSWQQRELHRIKSDLPADAVFRAFDELTWSEVPVFKALMSVRGLARGRGGDARIYDWFKSAGFVELARSDSELVVGAIEPVTKRRITTPTNPAEFAAFSDPGYVKIGFSFVVRYGQILTETRVAATDVTARRRFAAYWLLIRPFSGIIRWAWLRAIRIRAQKSAVITR
ncbi:hypothetical protein MU582_18750 [Nocardioidaceae bacterium SCSIO 66511]|nr:hypothetical protein MU582_18750 [Nocardioidaceae bacterium SCSIO 66511]